MGNFVIQNRFSDNDPHVEGIYYFRKKAGNKLFLLCLEIDQSPYAMKYFLGGFCALRDEDTTKTAKNKQNFKVLYSGSFEEFCFQNNGQDFYGYDPNRALYNYFLTKLK
jgi:hypothetical protein